MSGERATTLGAAARAWDRLAAWSAPTPESRLTQLAAADPRNGGPAGNERLTGAVAASLLVLLAAEGVTIVLLGPLLSEHMFIGMLLVPPIALKLSSTGYRFTRYYAHHAAYRAKGPPPMLLRLLAPLLIVSTLVVFATGVLLLLEGPDSRRSLLPIHKVSFFIWLATTAAHVIGHLPGLPAAARADYDRRAPLAGGARRRIALGASLAFGLLLALVLLPDVAPWLRSRG